MKKPRLSRRVAGALPFAALVIGGCLAGSGNGRVDREDEASNPNALGVSNVHIMPVMKASNAAPINKAGGAQLVYYGGPVISNIKIYTIFWGPSGGTTGVQFTSQLNSFYSGVTNSTFFDWLSEYNTTGSPGGTAGTNQTIGRGSLLGSYNYTSGATGTVDDSAIQTAIQNLIKAGTIPGPSNDATGNNTVLYAIHFAPGINITQGGQASCQVFCAYHGTIQNGSGYIYYSVIPDQGGSCNGGCGSDKSMFNNTTSVSSHEMIEATTDAAVGVAQGTGAPLAWYDTTNGEIGDICNAQQGSVVGGDGVTYTIQMEWSNKQGACVASGPGGSSSSSSSSSSGTGSSSSSTSSTGSSSTGSSSTGTGSSSTGSSSSGTGSSSSGTGSSSTGSSSTGSSSSGTGSSSTGSSSTGSSSSSTSSSSGGTCQHSPCTAGVHLTKTCDTCAGEVCAADPYCCSTQWDSVCVSEVPTYCGGSFCSGTGSSSSSGSSGSSSSGTGSSSSSSSSSSSGGGTCSHKLCSTGKPLKTTCDPTKCVLDICSYDPYCCTNKWDNICVSEVGSICGDTCPGI